MDISSQDGDNFCEQLTFELYLEILIIMTTLFLIPPSEGKTDWWYLELEKTSFAFEKPTKIIKHLSEKDVKCKWKRYNEALELNKNIDSWPFMPAVERYDGVMYKAIDYKTMTPWGQHFFAHHFLILSGMYGFLKPLDTIGNYKLPIEAKWLVRFWSQSLTKTLNTMECDTIISLLPESYVKAIDIKKLKKPFIQVNFLTLKNNKEIKMAHGSKKVKGECIRNICEKELSDFNTFWGKISQKNWITSIDFYENT
jgi:cytoplasmic iron level regulating protein YaaA (DUF328/UPF0246 family)